MSLSEDARRFSDIPFLATLEPRALEMIALLGETRIIRRGEALFASGEKGDAAFVLLSGRIKLDHGPDEGTIVEPGSMIGEMSLLVANERHSSALAIEPSAVLRIPRDVFTKVLADHPASAVRLREFCAQRLAGFTQSLESAMDALRKRDQP